MWDILQQSLIGKNDTSGQNPSDQKVTSTCKSAPWETQQHDRQGESNMMLSVIRPHESEINPFNFFEYLIDSEQFSAARYLHQCIKGVLPDMYHLVLEALKLLRNEKSLIQTSLNLLNFPQALASPQHEQQIEVSEVKNCQIGAITHK